MNCKYCSFLEDGDPTNDHEYLLDDDSYFTSRPYVVLKTREKEFSFPVAVEIKVHSSVDLHIRENKGCFLSLLTTVGENGYDNEVLWPDIKINYCPICGRKLNQGD